LELTSLNLAHDLRRFETPVFLCLGRLDMQVVSAVGAAWFDTLEAPHKQLIWFETSGHMPPFEEPELFNRTMVDTVRAFAT
jgi:proline iminopeptidase